MNRKIIQISAMPAKQEEASDAIVALADDGSLWFGYWHSHQVREADGRMTWDTTFEWQSVNGLPQNLSNLSKVKP